MKNELLEIKDTRLDVRDDKLLLVLYVSVALAFIISLVIFSLPADASNKIESGKVNGLVKLQPVVDGQGIFESGLTLSHQSGNVYAMHITSDNLSVAQSLMGIAALEVDQMAESGMPDPLMNEALFAKYHNSGVVVGMLSNVSNITTDGINELSKLEGAANVGFMSYMSSEPGSTVVMRNLYIGESNMLRALHYMMEYAKTTERPLVIELVLDPNKSLNPLFVQACENLSSPAIQFINNSDEPVLMGNGAHGMCYSMSLVNRKTGTTSDQTAFWCEDEQVDFELTMLGTDGKHCTFTIDNAKSADAFITLQNGSDNEVVLTAMDKNGDLQFFHVVSKSGAKQEIMSNTLFNGMEMMAVRSGSESAGLAPFHSKSSMVSGKNAAFMSRVETIDLSGETGSEFGFTNDNLALNLKNSSGSMEIEISEVSVDDLDIRVLDHEGNTVYYKRPGTEVESMTARLDLRNQTSDVFVLKVSTSTETKDYALVMR
ncbi:MAG: hypothetical protein ACI85F_001810 [Bacteroidia bacterium]|jgi:hypothetical protein